MSFAARRTLSRFFSKANSGVVHADHDQSLMLVFLGPRADIGQRAQPIDAGVGPGIDEQTLPRSAGRRQWLRIEPSGRAAERRQFAFKGQSPLRRASDPPQLLLRCYKALARRLKPTNVAASPSGSPFMRMHSVRLKTSTSSTAWAKACGASCGRLCPMPPLISGARICRRISWHRHWRPDAARHWHRLQE